MQLYLFLTALAISSAAPANYNQRQDGKLNVHAKLENVLVVVAPSSGSTLSSGIDSDLLGVLEDSLDFRKTSTDELNSKNEEKVPAIGEDEIKNVVKDIRGLEVFSESKKSADKNITESKLIGGGIENCGPGRIRDQFGICQFVDGSVEN